MRLLCALLLCGVALAVVPMTVHDLHSIKRMSGPAVSPKGDMAVASVSQWVESTNTKTNILYSISISSGTTGPFLGAQNVTATQYNPVFNADGSVLFFLGDDEYTIYQAIVSSRKVSVLTKLPVPVTSFKWSKTDKFFVFSAKVYLDCADPQLDCTKSRTDATAALGPNTVQIYTQLYIRHWDTWEVEGMYSHLFSYAVIKNSDGSFKTSGSPIDLMYKQLLASPVPPFGGAEQYDIAPTGDEVAFTAEVISHSTAWTTGYKIFTVQPLVAHAVPKSLTDFTDARTQNPLYSPDSKLLVYLAMDFAGTESGRLHLNVIDRKTGELRQDIAKSWDSTVGGYTFTTDSTAVIVDSDDDGFHKLFGIDLTDGYVVELISTGSCSSVSTVPNSQLVVLSRDFLTAPADAWKLDLGSNWRAGGTFVTTQLSKFNAEVLAKVHISAAESFYFNHADGTRVQGFLFKPYGWTESKKWPMAHLIHGGPESSWLDDWSYRWNPQLWASRGFATILINPRGSPGFGQAFTEAVRHDWGGKPFEDLMTGNDYIQQTYSWIDGTNQCACGASYGGFMINWINGHDDRFKCLVSHDGVFSSISMYYSTEEVFFNEYEMGPPPFESEGNRDAYERWNPSNFVGNWKTPMLVVHGGHDYRIPEAEGIGAFTALQRKGIESKLLYFPLENHWVTKQQNSIAWYDNVLSWLDHYTNNKPPQ